MVKVKLEQKRGRLVLHVGDLKLECTIVFVINYYNIKRKCRICLNL